MWIVLTTSFFGLGLCNWQQKSGFYLDYNEEEEEDDHNAQNDINDDNAREAISYQIGCFFYTLCKRQSVTRSLFQISRRTREFLSFNLMFETRTRISFSQSRASGREFLFSISDIETRTRIELETILARIFGNYIFCLFIDRYFQKKTVIFSKFLKMICLFFLEKFE